MSKITENAMADEIIALIRSVKEDSAEYIEKLPQAVGVSMQIFGAPVMKVVCGKKKQYISVNPICKRTLDDFTFVRTETPKSDPWIRVPLNSQDELRQMQPLFVGIYDDAYVTSAADRFGCCSRYEECSDERKCIHPDPLIARGCAYKLNLEKGLIFYGKNKTT